MSARVSRAWLYVRGPESVRIVVDGAQVAVYGPGILFSHSAFGEELDAVIHHTAIELELVTDGWTLEGLTTERRCTEMRQASAPTPERRSALRLVRDRRPSELSE